MNWTELNWYRTQFAGEQGGCRHHIRYRPRPRRDRHDSLQVGERGIQFCYPEMEFLDIPKDSSLLLHAIHSPLLLADFNENYTLLWF